MTFWMNSNKSEIIKLIKRQNKFRIENSQKMMSWNLQEQLDSRIHLKTAIVSKNFKQRSKH